MTNAPMGDAQSPRLTTAEIAEAERLESTAKRRTNAPAAVATRQGQGTRGWLGWLDHALTRLTASEWAFTGLLALCYVYFIMAPSTNTISRWDMVYALAHGQAIIDVHAKNSIDVSYYNGHWYSPRSLGLSLVATPILWALGLFVSLDFPQRVALATQIDLLNVLTVVPVGIVAALVMRRFIVRLRPQLAESPLPYVAAGAFALATLAYPFTVVFLSHAFGGGLLFIAFYLLYRARSAPHPARGLLLAGLLSGLAVISEYLAGVIFLILCGYILLAFPGKRLLSLILYGLGMAPSALALTWYNWFAFGNPLSVSYGFVSGSEFSGQHSGFFGVTLPRLSGLWQILVYPRGLLIESPFLLLIPLGLYLWYRSGVARLEALVIIAVSVAYPLIVSSYFLPMAGDSVPGPRLLVPMLPFACMGLAWLVDDARLWVRGALTLTLGVSLLVTFLYIITGVRIFHAYGAYPIFSLYLPTLRSGIVPPLNGATPSNLGARLLHLPQWLSIYVVGLALAAWFYAAAKALLARQTGASTQAH
ncbi:MAG TPA: hypothetical protein VF812_10505 [Ktedonobacterales bacterium]